MTKTDATGNVAGAAPGSGLPSAPHDLAVTYTGPTDRRDGTTVVSVPGHPERFRLNEVVMTSQALAAQLEQLDGHTFTIEPAKPVGDS